MKISLNWLKTYIDLDLSTEDISDALTTIGLEVEGVEEVESVKGGLRGVVVGHVKTCDKHPNADKLSLTTVDIGGEEDVQIVCGAPNVAAGQKVLVATVGTSLYSQDGEPWKIKKGKIRGEASHGMICAEDELGLGASHDGIMVLSQDAKVGMPAAELLKIENDIVFDIGLTPNRSDATSHIGVARDLVAYLKINNDYQNDVRWPEISSFRSETTALNFDVEVENVEACPRYSGVSISNVKVGESPDWLKKRLGSLGIRSINNIVDITNFVLHEVGQPLHAFDAKKVAKNKIIVSTLPEGSEFITLDEQERKLHASDLMICDGDKKPMCIAGVFGGIGSGVTNETTEIFLESAYFDPGYIRRTSTKHLLRTDAAKCYEKGADPNNTVWALKRAANLIKELAGGVIASDIIDEYPTEIKPKVIHLKYDNARRLIGADLDKDKIHEILRAQEMQIKPVDEHSIKVEVPTNKFDVTREVDVIEEILRIYGFNNVPIPSKIQSTLSYTNHPDRQLIKRTIVNYLAANGFNEMMNLSLSESKQYKADEELKDKFVFINNTSNINLDIMRPEMMLSGLNSVRYNLNRQSVDLKLFEFGKAYTQEDEKHNEAAKLTMFLSGRSKPESWQNGNNVTSLDFFDLKKYVNHLLDRLNVQGYQTSEASDDRWSYGLKYHRGPKTIVTFGKIANDVLKAMDVKGEIFYAEFEEDALFKATNTSLSVKPINKFPSSRRDLALVIDENITFDAIVKIARKVEKKILKELGLFDIFKSEKHLGKGKKSYALNFIFEHSEKTLKDKEIDKVMNQMISKFESELGAQIRK